MTELILFILTDVDNRIGFYAVLDYTFLTYNDCELYVETKIVNKIQTALTYCAPLDTRYKLGHNVYVITNW